MGAGGANPRPRKVLRMAADDDDDDVITYLLTECDICPLR